MKLYYLIKRDLNLLLQYWKRILLYLSSIIILDVIMLQYECFSQMIGSFEGISKQEFVNDPTQIPIQWIWGQLGTIFICVDIIKRDIYQIADCLLPHIKDKAYFWYSKVITGIIFSIILMAIIYVEKYMLFMMNSYLRNMSGVSLTDLTKAMVMQCLGIYTLYCIYIFINFIWNEMIGILLCISYVVAGLPFHTKFLYCNVFMYLRGTITSSLLTCCIIVSVTLFLGQYFMRKYDILKS